MSKKGENIYKRKDGRWEARYIKNHSEEEKPQIGYIYGYTYRDTKEKLLNAITENRINEKVKRNMKKNFFSIYCDEWMTVSRSRIKESTYTKYLGIVENHIKPYLGTLPLYDLNSITVEEFTYSLIHDKGLTAKTVKDILIVLKSILKYADRHTPNVLGNIDICCPKEPRKEIRVLTMEEQRRFINFLLEDMNEYKFGTLLSLLTGLRIGEVCALKWGNISFEDKTIKVSSTMQRIKDTDKNKHHKTKIIISDPKSDTSARIIPMTAETEMLFNRFRCDNKEAYLLSGTKKCIEPRVLQYQLKKFSKECGLEDIHFHVLRHTFATRCVEVGFEIKSLSEILGHSNPKITLERYVHSSMEMKRDNMNKLNSLALSVTQQGNLS